MIVAVYGKNSSRASVLGDAWEKWLDVWRGESRRHSRRDGKCVHLQ